VGRQRLLAPDDLPLRRHVSEPKFTEEQRKAVQRRTGPLLLAANAGSGKTSVMVERFVRFVVDDGIAPGRVLAITFTEKAAGELRARIRSRLLALGERRLAQDAEAAFVGTIHGFCARLLRGHAVAAGLDPGFAVLDEAAGRELHRAAFEQAVAGFLGGPEDPPRPAALDLLAAHGMDRLERTILDVYGELRSAGQVRPALPAPPRAPDTGELRAELARTRVAAAACLDGLDGSTVAKARAALERCGALLEGPDPAALAALEAARFSAGNTGALKAEPCRLYLEALGAYAEACLTGAGAGAVVLLDELLGRFADAYSHAKRERSAVDFDDLELFVRDLFDRSPALAATWAERFERIMVDEFQDTNALQVDLLERLDRGHTFVVGDELQSIYGFRHASVEVFRELRERRDQEDAVAVLAHNFRSRPEILEAINVAAPALHGERYERLVAAREPAGEARVELLVTDACNGNWDDVELGVLPGGPRWRWAEARLLAQRIDELIASGAHRAGEIVVLMRAATDIATYERALEDRGLTTLAAGGRGFWARQQVQDLTQYLAALANPLDEPALLGVLASPLGPGLSSDALARCSLAARAAGHTRPEAVGPTRLWRVVEDPAAMAELPAADAERLAAWREDFVAERELAPRLSLAALLDRAIAAARYDEHVLRLPGGIRRLANVRKLVRLAGAYEIERGRDVRGFIDRAHAELEAEAREADAPVELAGLDAVRLMTIHAAKGLEFPVVAVADLGRDPNLSMPDVLVAGDRVGVRLVTMNGKGKALDYEQLAADRLARERAEALRVLHVAMTRAEERLILSGAANVGRWPDPAGERCAPIAWLGPAFVADLAARLQSEGPVFEERRELDGDVLHVRVTLNAPEHAGTVLELRPAATGEAPAPERPPREPLATGAAERPPAVPTLSYSALSRHAQCGYRFYLERILRLPPQQAPPMPATEAAPAVPGIDLLLRGTLAHEMLEHADLADPRVPDAVAVRERAARHDTELTDEEVGDLQTLVGAALGGELMARVRAAAKVYREHGFALALGAASDAPLLTGFVDVLAIEDDGSALVVDYKTDHLGEKSPEAAVEAAYTGQRHIYALAALRGGAPRVEVAHLFLERPAEPAVASYEATEVDRLEAQVVEHAAGALDGRFPVAEHPHRELCATCPGRGGLCSWPEEVALQPLG
jgi:ATP-dependent helicase/nuclease subunit A